MGDEDINTVFTIICGNGKGTQVVGFTTEMETLSQDYYKPVSELKDKELFLSTLTEDSRPKSFGDNKICLEHLVDPEVVSLGTVFCVTDQ